MGRHVASVGEVRNAYKILIGKTEEKRPFVRITRSLEDNIRMDLKEIGWNWIHLAQDRGQWQALVNKVMSLRLS
jgi:hypothetical protein